MLANDFKRSSSSLVLSFLRRAQAVLHPAVMVVAAFLVSLVIVSSAHAQSSTIERLRSQIHDEVSGLRAPVAGSGFYRARYRPDHGRFRTLPTDRFDLIYPAGDSSSVASFRRALAAHAAATDSLLGHDDTLRLPVILNDRSDIANGYVAYRPLRSEIYTAHPTHALSTGFSSWPEAVAPHELVHALHADLDSGFGVGGALGVFAPDASRQLHVAVPRGWTEGIAVYRESQLRPRAGRLNEPLSLMRYRASVASDDPWGLGEVLFPESYEHPIGRHYLGGGQFMEYLMDTHGPEAFQKTTRRNHQWSLFPRFAFGLALWNGTGVSPWQLSDRFVAAEENEEHQRLNALSDLSTPDVIAAEDGFHHRRPVWTSDSTLVVYGSGYRSRPGFYRYNVRSGARERIATTTITQDRTYTLTPDSTALLFARPHFHPLLQDQTQTHIHRLSLASGKTSQISEASGVFAPAEHAGGATWVAQRDGTHSTLAHLETDSTSRLSESGPLRLRAIAPSPTAEDVAVLAGEGPRQGIYRTASDGSALEPWLRFEDGNIYDLSWGPNGRYLLFAAGPSGVPNAYAYDTRSDRVVRLTTVRFGALEPNLSPDGTTLAFVRYQHEQFDVVQMPFEPDGAPIADGIERTWPSPATASGSSGPVGRRLTAQAQANASGPAAPPRSGSASDSTTGDKTQARSEQTDPESADPHLDESRPYQAWRHMQPRILAPSLLLPEDAGINDSDAGDRLGPGIGVQVAGADPLQTWAYQARGYYQAERFWGEVSLNTGHLPGTPGVAAFRRPYQTTIGNRNAIIEERGVGLAVGDLVVLQNNVYTSAVGASVRGQFRQTRPIDASGTPLRDAFVDRTTVGGTLVASIRTQRNTRDLVPRTGIVATTTAETDLYTSSGRGASRALQQRLDLYWPLLSSMNGGLRTSAAVLTQSEASIFDTESSLPRGYLPTDLADPGSGTYVRLDAAYTQPLWYIDAGSALLPFQFDALYGFGLAQAQYRLDADADGLSNGFTDRRASITSGLGIEISTVRVELGLAYRFDLADIGPPEDSSVPGAWGVVLKVR